MQIKIKRDILSLFVALGFGNKYANQKTKSSIKSRLFHTKTLPLFFTPQNYCSFSTPANNFLKKWDKKNKVACATLCFYAYMPNHLCLKRGIILRHIWYYVCITVE